MKYALFLAVGLFAAAPDKAAADFALGRWDVLYARFSPDLKSAMTMDKLRGLAEFGRCGVPAGQPTPGKTSPGSAAYVYTLVCEKKTVGLSLSAASDGLIHQLFIVEPVNPHNGPAVITGEFALPAKLTLPEGAGPFPAAVLVHGSGPNDMDETIGPNKPFRDIGDGLAARGIATLRYTKRTKQYGAALPAGITLREETIDDAVSAAAMLRNTANIDPKRIFIIGHSLGAHAAPRIGQADPALAGLVLLAGNTRSLDVLLDEQIQYLGGTKEQAESIKKRIPDVYRKDLAAHDPVAIARELRMPMLILQGERDYQVTMEDFKGWQTLKSPRVTLKSYPAMNHLFHPGQGKSKPGEYKLIAPFSPIVLDDIAAWIKR